MNTIKEIKKMPTNSEVEVTALVTNLNVSKAKNGSDYAFMTLTDKTSEVETKKWRLTPLEKDLLKQGKVIRAKGKLGEYQGKTQFTIDEFIVLDVPQSEFTMSAIPDPELLIKEMKDIVSEVKTDSIRVMLEGILGDEKYQGIWYWPAASGMHHAEKYGWLAHTTRMMRLAKSVCQSINKYSHVINEDMVVAGCMLHDLGKLYELKPNELGSGDYTKNSLLGHIYISASIVRDMEKDGLIDKETSFQLQHIILSHHGKLEYGSPVAPATKEAVVVSMIDNMDAKLFAAETEALKTEVGELSEKPNFCLGSRFYATE